MAKKTSKPYSIEVIGRAVGPWSGPRPESIDPLIEKSQEKELFAVEMDILKNQIDRLLQTGDVSGATDLLDAFRKNRSMVKTFDAPLCVFAKDMQNGANPYIGAHCFFGAFRNRAQVLCWEFFYQKGMKGFANKPSAKHLRRQVNIRPNHVFLYRPDLDGEIITGADYIDGQQPVGEVKGFARYEVIQPPFAFRFSIDVDPRSEKYFEKLLSDQDQVVQIVGSMWREGLGARRSAGHGYWEIVSMEIVDS